MFPLVLKRFSSKDYTEQMLIFTSLLNGLFLTFNLYYVCLMIYATVIVLLYRKCSLFFKHVRSLASNYHYSIRSTNIPYRNERNVTKIYKVEDKLLNLLKNINFHR